MRKALAISEGAMAAVVSTHGLVYAGIHLDPHHPMPVLTYRGSFEHILLASWRFWNSVHGWEPLSHAGDFGKILALATLLTCPLLGFLVFWLTSGLELGWARWKPLAIAIASTTPLQQVLSGAFRSTSIDAAQAEAARALVVFLLMVASSGAIRFAKRAPSGDSAHLATPFPRAAS
jgi:hypothetical protein